MRNRSVKTQVRVLERRVRSSEATIKFMFGAQTGKFKAAEKIRLAARALVRSQWQHRCEDRIGGCTAVSDSKLAELEAALKGVRKLYTPTAKRIVRILARMSGK